MHTLTLNNDEKSLLLGLVQRRLKELPHEIHQTDSHTYRDGLVAEKSALEQLATKVQTS
jgi:hypothetical protein